MKPGPLIILNIILIAVGIFVYDSMRDDGPKHLNPPTDYETYPGDLDQPGDDGSSEPLLYGGGNETLAQANSVRLSRIENAIQALRVPGSTNSPDGSGSDTPSTSGGTYVPTIGPDDTVDPETPYFDEAKLKNIESYLDEIQRRKAEARQRSRIEAELKRQELELSDAQRDAVVRETLRYQTKARNVMRSSFARDEKGRDARRAAFEDLQQEYATVIGGLVPSEDAEKIMNSRISRGMGFYGRSNPRRGSAGRNR